MQEDFSYAKKCTLRMNGHRIGSVSHGSDICQELFQEKGVVLLRNIRGGSEDILPAQLLPPLRRRSTEGIPVDPQPKIRIALFQRDIGLQRRKVKQKFKRTRNRGMPVGGEDEKQQWDFPLLFFRWVYRVEPPAKALSAAGQAVPREIWRLQLRQRSRAMTVEIRVVTALEKMIPSRAKRRSISSSTGRKMRPFCMREVRVA